MSVMSGARRRIYKSLTGSHMPNASDWTQRSKGIQGARAVQVSLAKNGDPMRHKAFAKKVHAMINAEELGS